MARSRRTVVARSAGVTLLGVLAASCATSGSNVRVDAIEGDLPKCQSFAWNPTPSGDATSFTEQRVRNAVMARLKEKGYTESDKADCRIAYNFTSRTIEKPRPSVGVGVGGGSRGIGGGIGVSLPVGKRKGERGTFTLDVIDSAKNAQVWSGTIDAAFDSPELSESEAQEVVDAVLSRYPDR